MIAFYELMANDTIYSYQLTYDFQRDQYGFIYRHEGGRDNPLARFGRECGSLATAFVPMADAASELGEAIRKAFGHYPVG